MEINEKIGSLSKENKNQKSNKYFHAIVDIFISLEFKPLVYIYTFSSLLFNQGLASLNGKTIDEYINSIVYLWELTQEIVNGLNELSKNIIQHSTTKCGVIVVGISTTDTWEGFVDGNANKYFQIKTESNNNKIKSFCHISVQDLGNLSIIDTLKKNYNTITDPRLTNYIDEDKKIIENNDIKFTDFLNINKENSLLHQMKRVTAHLGLLILSKTIERNYGFIQASCNGLINSETFLAL